MQLVHYNPLVAITIDRLCEIAAEFLRAAVIVLVGTQARSLLPEGVHRVHGVPGFLVYCFGYGRGAYTNKSCGITIIFLGYNLVKEGAANV